MLSKRHWRVAIPFLFLILLVMGGLAAFARRSECAASSTCIQRAIWIAAGLLAVGGAAIALFQAERTSRLLRQLSELARNIGDGKGNGRYLPQKQDDAGELIRAFNRLDDELNGRIAQLTEEKRQLTVGVQFMPDGLIIADEAGTVRLINPVAASLLNIKKKKAVNTPIANVVRHHQLIEMWQRCRETNDEQVAAVEIGRDLFLRAVVTPYRKKETRGYLVILQDLTQIRALQTIRRDFISNISHELRTPLASLRAVVETLQDGALDDPPAAERFLGRAEHEIYTLTQMVEELLELSRIESGLVPFKLEETAVSDLLLTPLERLQPQAKREDVALILDLPAHLPLVLADAERAQRVVTNLLHNAVKFTPHGGKITVHARLNKKKTAVVISVKDTGPGILAADQPRIFERFYKSDRARTRGGGGTGLGLAIARHIVQAHNGRIWVKSKKKRGSAFYFTLPVAC